MAAIARAGLVIGLSTTLTLSGYAESSSEELAGPHRAAISNIDTLSRSLSSLALPNMILSAPAPLEVRTTGAATHLGATSIVANQQPEQVRYSNPTSIPAADKTQRAPKHAPPKKPAHANQPGDRMRTDNNFAHKELPAIIQKYGDGLEVVHGTRETERGVNGPGAITVTHPGMTPGCGSQFMFSTNDRDIQIDIGVFGKVNEIGTAADYSDSGGLAHADPTAAKQYKKVLPKQQVQQIVSYLKSTNYELCNLPAVVAQLHPSLHLWLHHQCGHLIGALQLRALNPNPTPWLEQHANSLAYKAAVFVCDDIVK